MFCELDCDDYELDCNVVRVLRRAVETSSGSCVLCRILVHTCEWVAVSLPALVATLNARSPVSVPFPPCTPPLSISSNSFRLGVDLFHPALHAPVESVTTDGRHRTAATAGDNKQEVIEASGI
ncbi:hypothetical protein M404DRAFT_821754 [Pisolithus tinctorius Marx 270]|uniref:Uncharacterized protein n=1 Tax=Pisolithus tinctorius Marx 270 TaxID=870435 RepID=A0A0C3NV81_PISTI|nr:hypothetical protein M404DRAFT_821754 [Pisolithus tinctorius Marx 270]